MKQSALILAGLALALGSCAYAGQAADVIKEIETRCNEQMGAYGEGMIGPCIEGDVRAINALSEYPPEYGAVIARCMETMRPCGYAMVKTSVDEAARSGTE